MKMRKILTAIIAGAMTAITLAVPMSAATYGNVRYARTSPVIEEESYTAFSSEDKVFDGIILSYVEFRKG